MSRPNSPLPPGWREVRLAEVCELQGGPSWATLRTGQHDGEGVPLVRPRDISDRRITPDGVGRLPEGAVPVQSSHHRLRPGDVLLARSGAVGRTALVSEQQAGWLFSGHLVRIRPLDDVLPDFLVGHLSRPAVATYIARHTRGSTIQHISLRDLGGIPVALPPLHTQREIGGQLAALDEKVRIHTEIARTTAELRETLGDLLFTGLLGTR
ncbi:restriction endonuclease subunit S [Streptomyces pini]|uniref:Type I restriction enzyme, S subunit/type I restriction enzyme M protein n=1 Tax=Streptomyces pini TaxID=1520580 RepID=A0A1I3UFP1_9ACTN|nr:restriction endonuclease subunit S [Streptomyces pini]SFJ82314.1 type I restriction enzyme, S subunit/type I restriction enzyme M protein [Streptomyces pini]